MCNLYSLTRTPEELRRAFRIMHDRTGNLPPLPDVFPDQLAPVVRTGKDGERELTMMRWGFPPPPALGTRPVTNVRNVKSPYWRGWLKPDFRCLVPATSFCEYTDSRPKVPHWFALDETRPVFAFAGIWRPWTGTRGTKAAPAEGEHHRPARSGSRPGAVGLPHATGESRPRGPRGPAPRTTAGDRADADRRDR